MTVEKTTDQIPEPAEAQIQNAGIGMNDRDGAQRNRVLPELKCPEEKAMALSKTLSINGERVSGDPATPRRP